MKNETQAYYAELTDGLKKFISSNISNRLSLTILAKKAAVSVFHLSRIFKQVEGVTLKNYLHQCKMYNCLQQVLYTNRKLNDISFKCGFEDYASFCRGFKRIYKVSPDDLRKIILDIKAKNNIPLNAVVCIKPSMLSNAESELKKLPNNSNVFMAQRTGNSSKRKFVIHPYIIP